MGACGSEPPGRLEAASAAVARSRAAGSGPARGSVHPQQTAQAVHPPSACSRPLPAAAGVSGLPLLTPPSPSFPAPDYYTLLRFLRARNYEQDKAFKMWCDTLAWRREFDVDTILENFTFHEREQFLMAYVSRRARGLPTAAPR
jgi:hypothetical protein